MLLLLLQIKVSQFEAGAIFGALLGGLLGLIPLIFGIVKKQAKIGVLGFVAAIVGNALLGILASIPIIGFCVYLIMKKDAVPAATRYETNDDGNSGIS